MELNRSLTAVEKVEHAAKISTARQAAEAEPGRLQAEAAANALEIWNTSPAATQIIRIY